MWLLLLQRYRHSLLCSIQLRTVTSLKAPCTRESPKPAAKTWHLARTVPRHPSQIWKVTCKAAPKTSSWRHSKRNPGSLKAVMYEVMDVNSSRGKRKRAKGGAADSPAGLARSWAPAEAADSAVPAQGTRASQGGHGLGGARSPLSPAHPAKQRQCPPCLQPTGAQLPGGFCCKMALSGSTGHHRCLQEMV